MHHLLLFKVAFTDLIPWFVIGGAFALISVLVIGVALMKRSEIRWRRTLEPLCEWEYSSEDWPRIAETHDLAELPEGAASIKITKLDIWITDENCGRRNELDGDRRCVTGCVYENGMFKIRIRSWAATTRGGGRYYTKVDLRLPVPAGHEQAAQAAADYFIQTIGKQSDKIASVLPDDVPVGIFDETGL